MIYCKISPTEFPIKIYQTQNNLVQEIKTDIDGVVSSILNIWTQEEPIVIGGPINLVSYYIDLINKQLPNKYAIHEGEYDNYV